jgi:hypothetical protein
MTAIPAAVGPDHTIDLDAPDFEPIPWRVLIDAMCVMPRFNGAFGAEPTIGGHSLHVMDVADEDLKLAALIHDVHENPLGDIVRPVRRQLDRLFCNTWGEIFDPNRHTMPQPLAILEESLQTALFAKAGLAWPLDPDRMERLNEADQAVGAHELHLGRQRRLHTLPNDYRNPSPDQVERALRALLDKHGVPYGVEV